MVGNSGVSTYPVKQRQKLQPLHLEDRVYTVLHGWDPAFEIARCEDYPCIGVYVHEFFDEERTGEVSDGL